MPMVTITDSDTLAISLDDSTGTFYNLGPPPTAARVTQEYHESLLDGFPSSLVTHLYHESLLNGVPTSFVTRLYWETCVSVNKSTIIDIDVLDISLTEINKKIIKDIDSLDISLGENDPSQLIDVEPNILPINQPFVLLYAIGFGFLSGAKISFNGVLLPSTVISPNFVTAKVPSRLIAPIGNIKIDVING